MNDEEKPPIYLSDGESIRTEVDLRADGLLWMINTVIFHPRGLALTLYPDEEKLMLQGDGLEAWSFRPEISDDCKAKFEHLLERHFDKFENR